MSQISWLSRGLNVGRSVFLLGSKNRQPLSTSVNPNREPSRPIKESSEQAVGGTTDDIAHSGGAFDSNEASPEKSADKISAKGGISMENSAANAGSSLSSDNTAVKKKSPNTQK
ncbi:hypothetical protein MJO28_001187 [Puccinia striiformis f. sp. tritici]|uniref:Uncharacterized protein n=3 Tax=Puccinia striiformis TaxID=27350 RepID=A0A0L0VQA6_9BASI|nr:hypothetical protein Pst134EA_000051 [Puccinia striiformis f. sp. tritici]KAI9601686.1 hypothetical protein H4Q26_001519 [Puccinia striiformis f. sp. tritici PST-130]KNE91133.1 hypothetical protein PSTG_15447 [Puccinia striiformis f. sp. tritici PST-78]POW08410.1 hypothetical protein PSTT_07504 [Puccinia striiformis]KAH9466173.1 hypothetical protein Pst134EB_001236 [Puccinia striiformis f. sp. tritici]KAH9466178.1 hypothetical protein Pst134EB_001241 [Puccinia striiformis f. sp. tritici]